MAHLTNYTFSKLCKKLEINRDIDLDLFVEYVYEDPQIYYILNKFEIKYLFNYRTLLEDEDKFYAEYYQEVPERVDTQTYVFERAGKLKYHLNNSCAFINKDFIDFNIPPEIQELGNEVVTEFREWFKSKGYAEEYYNGTLDTEKVVFNYNVKFPPKYKVPVLNENYELVKRLPNSNNVMREQEFDLTAFQETIIHLKTKYYNEFSCKVSRIISKFDYLLRKSDQEIEEKISEVFSPEFIGNYGMKKLKEKFKFSRDLKVKVIAELLEYFKWNYKIDDKDFNNVTLENFGLDCCGGCEKNVLQQRV
ncbi:hypothetical protein [Leeuwenhoekiella sp. W20_SRS_FM14]|uniref:hypothetical protein n=1 Tax=Leeuwenhoekiella sp. W20_SRS_FM14 TaxID=3240270 RepID=UPI003F97A95B